MRILIVNDDGISAPGIRKLVQIAVLFGEVWVVAPKEQCSAMSHRITVNGEIQVVKEGFEVKDVKAAYSVKGTPADCVKIALKYLLPERPDIVFSGINNGYNAGLDISYSGTVGAAMEALLNKIPAIAFSSELEGDYKITDQYLFQVISELLKEPIAKNEIWNVNIPCGEIKECKGVLKERIPAQEQFYADNYEKTDLTINSFALTACGIPAEDAKDGTDMRAVLDGYISIGKIRNTILKG